jgi:hypothetical protein
VRALFVTAGLLAIAGAAGAAGAAVPQPHTLSRSASGPIEALAQDGHDLAWAAGGGTKCNTVHVVGPDGSEVMPQPTTDSMTCHWDLTDGPMQLAFAAGISTALWTLHESGSSPVDYVMTAQVGGSEQRVDRLTHASDGTGLWLGGLVGAGTTLAYSFVDVEYVDKLGCASGGSCKKQIAGGGINLVSNGHSTPLVGAKPALGLAAASGRLAYVPATAVTATGAPTAGATAAIQIVDATSGAQCSVVHPQGVPLAIALSPHVLAVLTRSSGNVQLTWYAVPTAHGDTGCAVTTSQLSSAAVPRNTVPQIATSDHWVVYRAGRMLRGISVASGRVRTLARVAGTGIGLSLEAGQLAWAENWTDYGRIRALTVG